MTKPEALEKLKELTLAFRKGEIELKVGLPKNSLSAVLNGKEMPNTWPDKIVAYIDGVHKMIEQNNLPENKQRILVERNGVTFVAEKIKTAPDELSFSPTMKETDEVGDLLEAKAILERRCGQLEEEIVHLKAQLTIKSGEKPNLREFLASEGSSGNNFNPVSTQGQELQKKKRGF